VRNAAIIRVAVLSVVAASCALAGVYVREMRRDVRLLPGQAVVFHHRYGNLSIVAGPESVVRVVAQVRVTSADDARARQFAELVSIAGDGFHESVVFATVYPHVESPDSELSFEVRVSASVPAQAQTRAENAFGDLFADGLRGGCRLTNRYGSVELSRCGRSEVRNQFGDVRLVETDGPVAVTNSYGNVSMRGTQDHVMIENRYGAVQTSGGSGEISIDNMFGVVTARQAQGRLSIASRYGNVAAWVDDVNLSVLEVAARLGQVELNLARGVPFQLDGMVTGGAVRSALPLVVREFDGGRSVSGMLGSGGPMIEVHSVMGDMVVQQDSEAGARPAKER
jgi:hypothetical protein